MKASSFSLWNREGHPFLAFAHHELVGLEAGIFTERSSRLSARRGARGHLAYRRAKAPRRRYPHAGIEALIAASKRKSARRFSVMGSPICTAVAGAVFGEFQRREECAPWMPSFPMRAAGHHDHVARLLVFRSSIHARRVWPALRRWCPRKQGACPRNPGEKQRRRLPWGCRSYCRHLPREVHAIENAARVH